MKKILKDKFSGPNKLVRRVLSKTSNTSLSPARESKSQEKKRRMTQEHQLSTEIKALKDQIENLKAAVLTLQEDTESKEVALAKIAREKEKVTLELLKQRRSNSSLQKQLEDEREFYFKEKEIYCQEMNEVKKLKKAMSSSTSNNDEHSVEHYKKEIEKVKQSLNQTLAANYNLSIKFLRMKNTKTCLKTELKTMQLKHEKLVNEYKSQIEDLRAEMNDLIADRIRSPISASSKKYLHLVKQNSCLVYENLCLQLEVDNLNLKCEKLKLDKTKSETNNRLKYMKHEDHANKKAKKAFGRDHKRVRIKDEQPEKLEKNVLNIPSSSSSNRPSSSKEQITKIFEKTEIPGIPTLKIINEVEHSHHIPSCPSHLQNLPRTHYIVPEQQKVSADNFMDNVLKKRNSKLALFQVSNMTSETSVASTRLARVRSSPEIFKSNISEDF